MDAKELAKHSYARAMSNMVNNKNRAFAHFLVALTLCPEWRPQMIDSFIQLTERVGKDLLEDGRVEAFFKCYGEALDLYPNSAELKRFFAKHLSAIGLPYRAFTFYRQAYLISPDIPLWNRELDDLKNGLVARWHFKMLNDKIRNTAYKTAITKTVKYNDSVIDIGCGTGLLTLFAAEAKPKRIISIEANEALFDISVCTFKENKLEILTVNELSTTLKAQNILGYASLVVTEIFDAGFFGEGLLETMIHTRKKLMLNKPTDIVIPMSATLFACGVQSDKLAKKHIFLDKHLKDMIKFDKIHIFKDKDEPYDAEDLTKLKDLAYITNVERLLSINFCDVTILEQLLSGEREIEEIIVKCNNSGYIHAFAVWFELQLAEGVSLTTDPRDPNRANAWDQAIFYLNCPRLVTKNEEIKLKFSCRGGKLVLLKEELSEDCYAVASSTVRYLNDSVLVNSIDSAVSAACIHLSQTYANDSIHVLDLNPFPITGFLLLARGIPSLTCLAPSEIHKQMIIRVGELNGFRTDRITFFEDYDEILKKDGRCFHIVANNFLNEGSGELNIKHIVMARGLRPMRLEKKGLSMPHRIKLMATLIYSEDLERLNRLDDKNVLGYNLADLMNVYSVGQNFISDISSFSYIIMSEDIELLSNCVRKCGNNLVDLELLQDGLINAVMVWFEIQMLENGDLYSTKIEDSWSMCSVHLLETDLQVAAKQKSSILMCCDENGYLKISVDLE